MTSKENAVCEAKVVLLGTTLVGKTTIVTRATTGNFDSSIKPTVGACYASRVFQLPEGTVKLQIWDTAGQERFKTLVPMYYRGSRAAIIVFSVADPASFEEVEFWARGATSACTTAPAMVLVGNKTDLVHERCVSQDQAREMASRINARYFEVSALDGTGVEEMFGYVADVALQNVKKDQQQSETVVMTVNRKGAKKCC